MARRQGRRNALLHMLGAIGRVEQQLRRGLGSRLPRRMQQQLTQGLSQGRPPRLSRHQQLRALGHQTTRGEPRFEGFDLGGLATPVDALQHQEAPALSHRAPAARRSPQP